VGSKNCDKIALQRPIGGIKFSIFNSSNTQNAPGARAATEAIAAAHVELGKRQEGAEKRLGLFPFYFGCGFDAERSVVLNHFPLHE